MEVVKIGILGAADIAERRFLPALKKAEKFQFVGVAISDSSREEKAHRFINEYGGKIYLGYEELLRDCEIDAVYIPQPPSLHYKWAKLAISCGKHVLLEKPSTTALQDTQELVTLAQEAGVALNENYAFCHHKQVAAIQAVIESGKLGELRLVRSAFGFPYRNSLDFRYQKELGGGALLDCGGYTLKAAQFFLGKELTVEASMLNTTEKHDVDMFGSVMLKNRDGITAQLSFGMDNYYKCELEIWGSKGYLTVPRFFTPPADMETVVEVKTNEGSEVIKSEPDDQFLHIIEEFYECIHKPEKAKRCEDEMIKQMKLVDEIQKNA